MARAADKVPAERRGNVANLIAPAGVGNTRAATHSAYRELAIAPIRDEKLADLRKLYPHAPRELLSLQSHRAAQLELIWAWQATHGVIRNVNHGTIYPAAAFAEKLSSAYENALCRLAEHERQQGAVDPQAALDAVVAELAAARENGGGGDGGE